MTQLTFTVPDKNTKGYAKRIYRAAKFKESIDKHGFTPDAIESLIDFLADYVTGEREQVVAYLWDCTENQFTEMLDAVIGGGVEEVPPPKSEPSDTP